MAEINVKIETETGEALQEATVPHDIPVGQLLKVLPQKLGRSTLDASGDVLRYRAYHNGEQIPEDQTLAQFGMAEGSTITLQAEGQAAEVAS